MDKEERTSSAAEFEKYLYDKWNTRTDKHRYFCLTCGCFINNMPRNLKQIL